MLDVKLLRESLASAKERMATRGTIIDWDQFTSLDEQRRAALSNLDKLR